LTLNISKKAVEWAKTALIALLTASALFLAWRTGIFSEIFASIPFVGSVAELLGGASGAAEPGGASIKEAARPLSIVITDEEGERFGAKFNADERNAVYERTSSILGEALGSAAEPFEISEGEWRAAMSGVGLFYEYATPVRLSILDAWLGARKPDTAHDAILRRIFVAFGEGRSRLYYQEQGSGAFFCADTASAAGKAQELGEYSANGAAFAFETGVSGAGNAPYMLILPDRYFPEVRAAPVGNAEELLELALSALGLGDEANTTYYYGAESVLVCVGAQFNIRVNADGRVLYRRTDAMAAEGTAQALGEVELIEKARAIAADSAGASCGNAEVFFDSIEAGEAEGSFSVLFSFYIAGGRVFLPEDRPAALVTFASWEVSSVEMNFRDFTFTGERVRLLDGRLALAAAGGEFMLCYADTGADTMNPFWVRMPEYGERSSRR